MSTLAPARAAAIAAHSAALPPPATSTSYLRARSAMAAQLPGAADGSIAFAHVRRAASMNLGPARPRRRGVGYFVGDGEPVLLDEPVLLGVPLTCELVIIIIIIEC